MYQCSEWGSSSWKFDKWCNRYEWKKGPYECLGFKWKECGESPLQIIDQTMCPVTEEIVVADSELVRIELDDSLLKSFNELSDDELILAFGSFAPVQSLNPYMTKLSLCSISQVWLFITQYMLKYRNL